MIYTFKHFLILILGQEFFKTGRERAKWSRKKITTILQILYWKRILKPLNRVT